MDELANTQNGFCSCVPVHVHKNRYKRGCNMQQLNKGFKEWLSLVSVPVHQGRFPFVWKNRWEFSAKWNSTKFFHKKSGTGRACSIWQGLLFCVRAWEQATCNNKHGWQQMEHRFSDHFGKNEKRGIPLKVFLFSEKFPVEMPVPFDFPPERPVFPNKWKAPQDTNPKRVIYSIIEMDEETGGLSFCRRDVLLNVNVNFPRLQSWSE